MHETTAQILAAFDVLPVLDQQHVAAEILRRAVGLAPAELSDGALLAAADSLFEQLDAAEAGSGDSSAQ